MYMYTLPLPKKSNFNLPIFSCIGAPGLLTLGQGHIKCWSNSTNHIWLLYAGLHSSQKELWQTLANELNEICIKEPIQMTSNSELFLVKF